MVKFWVTYIRICRSWVTLAEVAWPGHVGSGFKSSICVDDLLDSGMIDFQYFGKFSNSFPDS